MWQENILAQAHLWRGSTTCMNILNKIERHNFCSNDLLTKSNRTELQTYKVEKPTFGTPRSLNWMVVLDKSNLLKIPDCRSFNVLKTLTGYRP